MVNYAVIENSVLSDGSYMAKICNSESKELDDVIAYMVAEGTGLTRPQAYAYFEKLVQTFEYFLSQGHRINTPLLRVTPSIGGKMLGKRDVFDPTRHTLHIRSCSGTRLSALENAIKTKKVKYRKALPNPEEFTDSVTGVANLSATPGDIGVLRGNLLKFDKDDLAQGIFFIAENDPTQETRVSSYSGVKPAEVHCRIPNLVPGSYRLVVRAFIGNNIREGEMDNLLTV